MQQPLADGDSLDDYAAGEERIAPEQPDPLDDLSLTGDETTLLGRTVDEAVTERREKKARKNGKHHHKD